MNPNGSKSKKKWGVDLNRNFPHEFGSKYLIGQIFGLVNFYLGRVGSSGDPNSTLYRGKHPLSEPESLCLANVMKKYEGIIKLYISVHSYGNVIMYPWSHTKKPTQDVYDLVSQQGNFRQSKTRKTVFRTSAARKPKTLYTIAEEDGIKWVVLLVWCVRPLCVLIMRKLWKFRLQI